LILSGDVIQFAPSFQPHFHGQSFSHLQKGPHFLPPYLGQGSSFCQGWAACISTAPGRHNPDGSQCHAVPAPAMELIRMDSSSLAQSDSALSSPQQFAQELAGDRLAVTISQMDSSALSVPWDGVSLACRIYS
jgi:hypothetical protein